MPLTEEERQRLMAEIGQGAPTHTATPPSPGSLPPQIAQQAGLQLQSMTLGKTPSVRYTAPTNDLKKHQDKKAIDDYYKQQAEKRKRITEIEKHLGEMRRSKEKLNTLFDTAKKKAPPISGVGALPGILPITKMARQVGNNMGFREGAMGFRDTFPLEARRHLQELEKGGRYTEQDVQQILQGATPGDFDTDIRFNEKRNALVSALEQELRLYEDELKKLGGAAPTAQADPLGLR